MARRDKKVEAADAEIVEDATNPRDRETAVSDEALEGEIEKEVGLEDAHADSPDALAVIPEIDLDAKIVHRDPLQAYMAEVTKHPLLTREEEISLAQSYRATGDVKAAYRLVASNLRLVVKLATSTTATRSRCST